MNKEINIKSLIVSLCKHVVWMIIIPILCACLMFAVTSFEDSTYSSHLTFASTNNTDSVDYIASSVQQVQLDMIPDYMNILKSDATLSRVSQNLSTSHGTIVSIAELRPMVAVEWKNENVAQFTVTVTSDSPELAEQVAKAISAVYVPIVEDMYEKEGLVKNLSRDFTASENKPNFLKNSLIAAAAGFIVTFAVCFFIAYNDKTIRTEEELKKQLELPVIGVIPKWRKS